jgi:beta-lactamase class A
VSVRNDWSAVELAARTAERGGGAVGVAIAWNGAMAYEWRGGQRFRAASTVKIPIMAEFYRQVDAGLLWLDDRYRLRDEDRTPGSGVLQYLQTGTELTLEDVCTLMIAISDNTATNVLLDRVGMERVTATMAELGMTDSTLGRRMLGRLPEAHEGENWATARDYATALAAITAGTAASAESCARMVMMLERQTASRRVTRHVPAGVRWGSKTGSLPGVVNDVGFVLSPRGTLVIAVFSDGLPSEEDGERAIAEIARAAMTATEVLPRSED